MRADDFAPSVNSICLIPTTFILPLSQSVMKSTSFPLTLYVLGRGVVIVPANHEGTFHQLRLNTMLE